MITVIVGIDHEADRLVGDAQVLERGLNFFRQGSELIVDDNDSVFANRGGDVAALAFEHIDVAGNFSDLDLDLGPIGSLLLANDAAAEKGGGYQGE